MNALGVPVQQAPWQAGAAGGESVHVFGDGLVGTITRPAAGAPRRDAALVLLNAGMVQRSGPHRGSVLLARALAARGFAVLRFDQSGLGDSPVSTRVTGNRRGEELAAAFELLSAQVGARRFVVGGICSAADNAFRLAADRPRIDGLLMLDGLGYRTFGWWLRHLPPRLRPRKLWNWWRQRGSGTDMANFRDFPTRAEARAQMQAMAGRGMRMLFVYTGGAYRYFNHAGQFVASLGPGARAPAATLAYWRDSDHTFYRARDRERLQGLVAEWMEREFGQGSS